MIRLSDIAVLFICSLALLFELQHISSYRLENVAHLRARDGLTVQPVIDDLDGDGKADVIFAGIGGSDKISVYSWKGGQFHERLHNTIRQSRDISTSAEIFRVTTCALSRQNFLQRHVIIVTTNLDLIVMDDKLSVIWTTGIPDPARGSKYIDGYEIVLIGTDIPIWQGDNSLVVVGVRFHQEDALEKNQWRHEADFISDNSTNKKKQEESDEHAADGHDDESGDDHSTKTTNYFNYYAFEGLSGEFRWKHQVLRENDWEERDADGNIFMSPHSWKMHVASQRHFEEQHWEVVHNSIISTLPHKWYNTDDSHFQLARFGKQTKIGKKREKLETRRSDGKPEILSQEHVWNSEAVGVSQKTLPSIIQKKVNVYEYENDPNVLVAHTSLGIEAIHLYTGRPVTMLRLRNHAVYDDFTGDTHIDQIWARVGREALLHHERLLEPHKGHYASCSAMFGSGVPNSRQLIGNVSICNHGGWFSQVKMEDDNIIEAANPIVINSHDTHFLKDLIPASKHAIFLTNDGTLTSINSHYTSTFQISTECYWDPFDNYFALTPTLSPFKIHAYLLPRSYHSSNFAFRSVDRNSIDNDDDILVVATKILIVTGTGKILAEEPLTFGEIPESYPVVGDVNGDGINDILIRSKDGYSLYLLQGTGSYLFPTIVAIIVVVIFVVLVRSGVRFQQHLQQQQQQQQQQQHEVHDNPDYQQKQPQQTEHYQEHQEPMYNLQQQQYEHYQQQPQQQQQQDFTQQFVPQLYAESMASIEAEKND